MSYKTIVFCVIFINNYLCDADILTDFSVKCSIKDAECQKNTLSALLREGAEAGIPELGIPPLDPYKAAEDTTISILGMVGLTVTEGQVEGATNCSFIKFESNLDQRYTYTESFCDYIKISGNYKIEVGPLAQSLIGNPVSGDGHGGIEIDKMVLKMKIPFSIEKFDDEKIYLVPKIEKAEYSTHDIENIIFSAPNIMVGDREMSEPLMKFMNKNWRMILRSFGKYFSDKVMETFYDYLKKFFIKMPASEMICDAHILDSYVSSQNLI